MNEEKVFIKTKISKQDYKAVVYFNTFFKNKFLTVIVLSGLIIAVTNLLQRLMGYNVNKVIFYMSISFLVVLIVCLVTVEFFIKNYINSDKISLEADMEITIDNEKILYETKNIKSTAELSLNKLYKAYETKKYFFIFINTQEAIIIKKEDTNTENINKLRDILKQNNILK